MNLSIKRAQKEAATLKVEHKIKVRVYTLIHELIQSNVTSKLLYGLLILIETAQFLWFMVHPRFDFLWTTDAANALRIPLKYLQFNAILELDNSVIFLVCLYSVIGIEIFIAVLIFIIMRAHNNHEKRNSTLLTYSIKIVSLFAMLMTTVLVIPFFNVFIATFYCNNEDYVHGDMTCYSGVYIVHFAMAVIGVVLFFIYVVMFLPFFTDLNPWSTLPTASPMSIVPFGKLLMKIFCPAYFTVDFKGTLNVQFAAIAGIYWLIVCFFRYQALPYYDRNINRFILICESILLWSGGVLNIHAFLDLGTVDNIGLLFLVIAAPFISTTFVALVEKTYADVIHDDPKAIKKAEEMEVYIDTLIHLIEHRHDPVKRIKLEGVLKLYAIRNTKPDTVNACTKLIKANLKEDSQHKDELWYEWLEEILEEAIEKFEKGATLHLINAYLHQEKLENRFKALYELLLTDENKPEIQQEFAIFCYKNIIEEEIIEHDNNNSENKGIDVNLLVDFQNKFVDFQTHIEKSVSYHLDFWRELLEDNPDIQKLQNLSSKITNSVEEVAANFYKISEINNNHTKMLRIYGSFLRDIVNDDAEGRKLLEKAEYIEKTSSANRQFIDNERLKYGENSNTCIVTCNGNYSSIGSISNINNEITRILEFTKGELLGQNINRIMPKIIADSHDAFMKRYFETSESLVMGQERIVFPITKKGYLVPCSLMIKVLPTLDDGIKVVGFLKDLENESGKGLENDENVHYIMYGGENNLVFGISASCENSFGIPLNLLYGNGSANELSIDQILPELLAFAPDDLKNPNGFVTTLDSTTIQQNYHLGDNGSESGEEDGNTEIAEKFKKTRIRAVLIQDDKYKDINPLRVLKFVEAIEGDDNFAAVKKILPDTKDKVGFDETKPSQEVQNDHLGPSEDRSLSQGGGDESNLNEKTKQLKDAKTLISEKNVPRSIKFLRRVGFLVVLSWLAVACVNFAMSFLLHDEVAEGSYATYVAYGRYDVMANINYQLRKLQLLSQQVNTTTDAAALNATANVLRNSLVTLIDNMQTLQFEVIKANIKMQRRSSTTLPDQVVTIESLLANTVKYDTANLTDALFTYLSQASTVRNSSLASFSDSSATEQTQKNFYAVRRNGLGSLRNGSQAAAEQFYDFYSDKTDYYKTVFLILAIVAIFVMFVGNAFSMPIVSSMHQTNKEVLSMFGYISTDEINDLAVKCERFIIDHLEDRADKKDYSLDLEEVREKDDDDKKEEDPLLKKKVDSGDNSAIDDAIDNNPRTPIRRKITNGSSPGNSGQKGSMVLDNNDDKINMNNIEEAEELIDQAKVEEIKFTRSQKLMNSRKNQNKSDIMKFLVVTAIYVGGSLGYFFYQRSQVNSCQTAFEHLKLVSQGIPFIRYINVYTLEELAENSTTSVYSYVLGSTSTTFNSRKYFISEVQDNERDISDSEKKGFPSQFDSYKNEYGSLYLGNLCQTYYTDSVDAATCENVLDALLDQGLKVGINTIISNSIDIMNEFYASDRSAASQAAFINSTEFVSSEDILTEIVPPLEDLLTSYYSAFGDFVDQSLNISRIWFSLAVTFLFFTLVFLWLPFLKRLRDDIWRTKGMLNMIPMEIISKNENLSEKFTNGELTKAVQ